MTTVKVCYCDHCHRAVVTTVKVCYCGAVPYSLVSVLVRFTDAVVVDINGKTEHSRGAPCYSGGREWGVGGGGGGLGRYTCVPVNTSISNFLFLKERRAGGGRSFENVSRTTP